MKKIPYLFVIICSICALFLTAKPAHADLPDDIDQSEIFVRGQVVQILKEGMQSFDGTQTYQQNFKIRILEGPQENKVVTIGYSYDGRFGTSQRLVDGDKVVIDSKLNPNGTRLDTIYEPYRLDDFAWVLGLFIVLIIGVAGTKGLGALVGLAISITTITFYIVPQIINGADPLTVCVTGAVVILFITTYIAHGFSVKTTVAIIGTAISLFVAMLLSIYAVSLLHMFGLGNDTVQSLQLATTKTINPQGLLLGGILIGTLGALNDITTTQAITIFTLVHENPRQHFLHVFSKSMNIGREHIASLINTLVLAYAGTSLAIFLFFALNPAHLPWWVILNNETTMEEILRTIVGSTALILAVPITSALASFIALRHEWLMDVIKGIIFS